MRLWLNRCYKSDVYVNIHQEFDLPYTLCFLGILAEGLMRE